MSRHRRLLVAAASAGSGFDARIAGSGSPLIRPTVKNTIVESILVAIKIRR
jgi:hypothetical protein